MNLEQYVRIVFPEGLMCNDAKQLCLRLFCTVDDLPEEVHHECNRGGLAETFASLSKSGFLTYVDKISKTKCGSVYEVVDKEFWDNVIATIFIKDNSINLQIRKKLDDHLKNINCRGGGLVSVHP